MVLIPNFNDPSLQVERGLCMHSTRYFIEDKRPFSEDAWSHRTAIYLKLAGELSNSRWEGFYAGLAFSEGVREKLSECSKPVETWTDDPNEYFIVGSDPIEEESVEEESIEGE